MEYRYPFEEYKKILETKSRTTFDGNYYCHLVKYYCLRHPPVNDATAFAYFSSCRCQECIDKRKKDLKDKGLLLQSMQEELAKSVVNQTELQMFINNQKEIEQRLLEQAELKAKEEALAQEEISKYGERVSHVPERYREFVFPQRKDPCQHDRPTASVTISRELRKAMVPHLKYLLEATCEKDSIQSKSGFNQNHVLSELVKHGLRHHKTLTKPIPDEEICRILDNMDKHGEAEDL